MLFFFKKVLLKFIALTYYDFHPNSLKVPFYSRLLGPPPSEWLQHWSEALFSSLFLYLQRIFDLGGEKMTSLDDLILIRFFKCYISIWMSGRHIKLNMPHQSSWSSLYTAHLASTTSVNSITIHQMQESFLTPVFPSHMHTIHQQVLLFLISKYLVYIKSISSHFHYQYP